jgi:hypothetical protein
MTPILIAVLALVTVGGSARAGLRAVETRRQARQHRQALDTLGAITQRVAADDASMPTVRSDPHAHVRLVSASTPPTRSLRRRSGVSAVHRPSGRGWSRGNSVPLDPASPGEVRINRDRRPAPLPLRAERPGWGGRRGLGRQPDAAPTSPLPWISAPPSPTPPSPASPSPASPWGRPLEPTPTDGWMPPALPGPGSGQPRPPAPSPAPVSIASGPSGAAPAARPAPASPWAGAVPGRRHPGPAGVLALTASIAVLVVAVAGVLILNHRGASTPSASAAAHRPPAASPTTTAAAPTTVAPTTTAVPAPATPVVLASATSGAVTYQLVSPGASIRVTASGPCWLEVRAGGASGQVAYEGTLAAGQQSTVAGPAWIRLGNPPAVSVTVNGVAVTPPGASSANPMDLQFTLG